MRNIHIYERLTDTLIPLVVIGVLLSFQDKGFLTAWPIIVCLAYSCIQPFVRFFIFDKLREKLLAQRLDWLLIGGSFAVYTALALLVCRWIVT